MSEPLAYADQWRAVIEAAGYRCQCPGGCGQSHAKRDTRCDAEHDRPAGKSPRPVRLVAAPADPTLSAIEAATLPPERLRAWCPACHDGARRVPRRRSAPESGQGGLFDL